MAKMKVTDLLKSMEIFAGLQESDLEKVAKLMRERNFKEGQVLFRQYDPGDSMYVVLSGRVKVWASDRMGREKVLAFFGEGDFFGEAGVLMGEPRTATAEAAAATKVLQLRKDDWDALLAWNVAVMREMLKVASQRQAAANIRLAQEASAEQAGVGTGRVFAFYGPRGGSGRTTLALNLAVILAQQQPDRVALVDLDLVFGHACVMLNLVPKSSLASITPNALRQFDKDSLNYYVVTHDTSLRVFVGAARPEEGEAVTAEHVKAVLDIMKRMYNVVIIDTGSSFSEATLAALEYADQIVMVATPEPGALKDLKECKRIFQELLVYPRERFYWLLNQIFPYKGLSAEAMQAELGVTLDLEIPFGAEGPTMAALRGEPFATQQPSSPIVKGLDRLGKELLQRVLEMQVNAGYAALAHEQAATRDAAAEVALPEPQPEPALESVAVTATVGAEDRPADGPRPAG